MEACDAELARNVRFWKDEDGVYALGSAMSRFKVRMATFYIKPGGDCTLESPHGLHRRRNGCSGICCWKSLRRIGVYAGNPSPSRRDALSAPCVFPSFRYEGHDAFERAS